MPESPPGVGLITFDKLGEVGRLGNQLFQYAALLSLALRTKRRIILPPAARHRLGSFRISASLSDTAVQHKVKHEFRERQFNYDESFFSAPPDCNFVGYFQSERYFADITDAVRREFTIADTNVVRRASGQVDAFRASQHGRPVVALHNRRGDNVPSGGLVLESKIHGTFRPDKERFHPLLSRDYIQAAMGQFEGCSFLVFSDTEADRAWCRTNMPGGHISVVEGNDDLTDFEMQRICDHNIIANSTFSWWAAWLNPNRSHKVVAPKKWFGEAYSHHDLEDLIPKGWTTL